MELYRALLRLYPADFREEYGRELCLVLEDRGFCWCGCMPCGEFSGKRPRSIVT